MFSMPTTGTERFPTSRLRWGWTLWRTARAFALADFDQDGRLEVFLKNRNAPQLRVLKNVMEDLPASIAFRLQGTKSNRDAIGASVTIETGVGPADAHAAGRIRVSFPTQQRCVLRPRRDEESSASIDSLAQRPRAGTSESSDQSQDLGGRRG